jgi:serine/threonine protein kinase
VTAAKALEEAPAPGFVKAPGAEPLPDYKLLEPLGKGGFGEVWKCEVPGGLVKAIKFVPLASDPLDNGALARQELQALEHIKSIRHPFMLSMERVEIAGGDLVIVTELADKSLADVLAEYQAAGKPGLPREELLAYLREAAEVLDFMSFQHHLQHLDIKPGNLFLVCNHVKVADFGLVHSLAPGDGMGRRAGSTPLYAAPETYEGQVSRFSDQYSLAITYQVLLTGTFPFQGKNSRQLMLGHLTGQPNLDALSPADRSLLAQALAKRPEDRFTSCLDFIQSLAEGREIAAPSPAPAPAAAPPPAAEEEPPPEDATDQEPPAKVTWLAPQDAIPGYELLECLRPNPLGDLWRVQAPDGRIRLALSLNVARNRPALVAKLRQLRHPALPRADILSSPSGRIFLVFDPFTQTLGERYNECRQEGLPGIPRLELLGYLAAAARALDELSRDLRLGHLGLNPNNLWLESEHVLLAEFGLVPLVWQAQGKPAGPVNPRYAAPELFAPGPAPAADQYSLALIYAEALTGLHPRPTRPSGRGGASGAGKLNLDLLPAFDRPVIARALQSDPRQRFDSCSELVQALEQSLPAEGEATRSLFQELPALLPVPASPGGAVPPESAWPAVEHVVSQWLATATGAVRLGETGGLHYLVFPGDVIEHRCAVRIIPGGLRLKLHDFPKQWQAHLEKQDDTTFVCRIPAVRNLWQRWFSGATGLIVCVTLQPLDDTPQLVEAAVRIEPYGSRSARLTEALSEVGPALIESLRAYLQPESGQREYERWPCSLSWSVYPASSDGQVCEPLEVLGKDLSLGGIRFRTPQPLPGDHFYLSLPSAGSSPSFAVLAHVRRQDPGADGWHEVGAGFGQGSAAAEPG